MFSHTSANIVESRNKVGGEGTFVVLEGVQARMAWFEDEGRSEGEKNHKKGGLNCVFGNFFFYVLDNCPQVQSLK